ncbi:MAG: hypothetical protein GY774_05485 [Planctomycetes bacterium]|nr:hypothetical protein [Planctomycetota bacterium]
MKRLKGQYLIASLALSGVVVLLFALISTSNGDILQLTEDELIAVVGGSCDPYSCVPLAPGPNCAILPDTDDDAFCKSKQFVDSEDFTRCIPEYIGWPCGRVRTTAPNPDTHCATDGNPAPRCVEHSRGCHKVRSLVCTQYYHSYGGCTCQVTGASFWWGTSHYVTGTLCES